MTFFLCVYSERKKRERAEKKDVKTRLSFDSEEEEDEPVVVKKKKSKTVLMLNVTLLNLLMLKR